MTNAIFFRRVFNSIIDFVVLVRFTSCLAGSFLAWRITTGHSLPVTSSALYASVFFFALAGTFALNAATDYKADSINTPMRPVARGAISVRTAFFCASMAYIVAVVIAMFMTLPGLLLTLMVITTSALYSFTWGKMPAIKNIGVAASVASIAIIPLIDQALFSIEDALIATMVFLFILQKEIISDIRDILGDTTTNNKTLVVSHPRIATVIVIVANIFLVLIALLSQKVFPFRSWFSVPAMVLLAINGIVATPIVYGKFCKAARSYINFAKIIYICGVAVV